MIYGEEKMLLLEPTTEYAQQIREYRREFLDSGDSMDGTDGLREMENPEEWIRHAEDFKCPEKVTAGRVPATQYIYVREEDRKIVGMIEIRHFFNDYLEKFGGHIGYCVSPSERRKGYATEMLKAVLPECKKLGLDRVLVTCDDDNEGSRRTILNNGGVYDGTVYEPDENVYLERYWIDIE
ncbi:MAG: GNAT family N-acetyltransferase [Oscillospiraceae bacterium]|nr:GNAT family N-acetyltransferase [Oscillospiraceae bacterium]